MSEIFKCDNCGTISTEFELDINHDRCPKCGGDSFTSSFLESG